MTALALGARLFRCCPPVNVTEAVLKLSHDDEGERDRALSALMLDKRGAVHALIAGLKAPMAAKAMSRMVLLLAAFEAREAVPVLLDLLDNDSRIITISRLANCQGCGVRDTQRSTTASTSPVNSNPTSFSTPTRQISAPELAARLAGEPTPILIDVREQWEYDIAHLPGSRLIPLSDPQMARY